MQINKTLLKLIVTTALSAAITSCSLYKEKNTDKINNKQTDSKIVQDVANINNKGTDSEILNLTEEGDLQVSKLKQNNAIYFDFDKYNIRAEFTEVLDDYANFLIKNPSSKINIEGHTDERGTAEYNISLGEQRANSIRTYLQNKGVHHDQLSIISYGKEKPAVLGHSESAYAKNRRVVINILS